MIVLQKFVITIMIYIELWYQWAITNLVERWSWKNWNYTVFMFKGPEIIKFKSFIHMDLKN